MALFLFSYNDSCLLSDFSDRQSSVVSLLESLNEGDKSWITELETEIIDEVQHTKQDMRTEDFTRLRTSLVNLIQEGNESGLKRSVLTSLCFESMTMWYSTIAKAHAKTCEWIFEDGNHPATGSAGRPRTRFME